MSNKPVKAKIPMIIGRDSVSVFFKGRMYPVSNTHPQYKAVLRAVRAGDLAALEAAISVKQTVANKSNGKITIVDGELMVDGEVLNTALSNRIVEIFRESKGEIDVQPLINFLQNLESLKTIDPTNYDRIAGELYLFLGHCNLPITHDGYFLAYKMVRDDFKDIYTGTMDNTPGKVVTMDRSRVDTNRQNTCSVGLHIASREYIENGRYGSVDSGHRMVVVKVNPADVISIPNDYNNSKGRVCRYEVVEAVEWDKLLPSNYVPNPDADDVEDTGEEDDHDGWNSSSDDDWDSSSESDDNVDTSAHTYSTYFNDGEVQGIVDDIEGGFSLTGLASDYFVSARTIGRVRDKYYAVNHSRKPFNGGSAKTRVTYGWCWTTNYRPKNLTDEQVNDIYKLFYTNGASYASIAKAVGTSDKTVARVLDNLL